MSRTWQVQAAKARFSELLEPEHRRPQIVTKRGMETAVLVPIDQRRQLEQQAKPEIKELLLAPEARTDELTPPRRDHCHRAYPEFERHEITRCVCSTRWSPSSPSDAVDRAQPPWATEGSRTAPLFRAARTSSASLRPAR